MITVTARVPSPATSKSSFVTDIGTSSDAHAAVRQEMLAILRRGRRSSEFSRTAPTRWNPFQVVNPESGFPFGDAGAWDLIVQHLESGHPLECVELDKPPGKKGYVMMITLTVDRPPLYVKLQIGEGCVLGRSFHYSDT